MPLGLSGDHGVWGQEDPRRIRSRDLGWDAREKFVLDKRRVAIRKENKSIGALGREVQ